MKKFIYVCLVSASFYQPQPLLGGFEDTQESMPEESIKNFNVIVESYEQQIQNNPNDTKLILAVAEVYYSLKEWSKAILYYKQALKLDPDNLKIQTALGLSYVNNHQIEPSKILFEEVLKKEPNNIEALGGLGRIEALKNNYLSAEIFYQKALALNPNHYTSLFYLADLRIEEKNFKEAEQILTKLAKIDPTAIWVKQALKRAKLGPLKENANTFIEQGNIKGALAVYKEEIAKNHDLEIYQALANLYVDNQNYPAALELLNEAKKYYPTENSLNLSLAYTYLAQKDFNNASYLFESSLRSNQGKSEALAGLGRIAALKGDYPQAEKYYLSAIEENTLNTLALSYLAELKLLQNQYQEAKELYQEIYQIDPKAEWAKRAAQEAEIGPTLKQIQTDEKNGNFDEAQKLYVDLINTHPNHVDSYLRYAKFYRTQKNYKKSLEVIEQGLKVNPKSEILYTALAHDLRYNQQYEKSLEALDIAMRLNPADAEIYAELGKLYEEKGDLKGASENYQKALALNPKNITALSYKIDLSMKQKNFSEAEKQIDRLLDVNPSSHWAEQLKNKARYGKEFDEINALINQQEFPKAIQKLQAIIQASPKNEEAYLSLGRLYHSLQEESNAIKVYEQGLDKNPESSLLLADIGLTWLHSNDLGKAKTALEKAYAQDSSNADALAGLGKLAAMRGDNQEAESFYKTAIKINAESILSMSYYAEYLLKQKRFKEAGELYKKIFKLNPAATWAQIEATKADYAPELEKGAIFEKNKNFKGAESLYKELIAKEPDQPNFYAVLAQLYYKAKKYDEAKQVYLEGLKQVPDSLDLQNGLGFVYLSQKNVQDAKNSFSSVISKQPQNGEALAGLGKLQELTGNTNESLRYYQKALALNPQNMSALVFLANLYYDLGNYEKAQKIYKKIYSLDAQSKWALNAARDAKYGRLLNEIKLKEEAKDILSAEILWNQLLNEQPNVADYHLKVGSFYHRIYAYDKAIEKFNAGLKINPHSSDLYAQLGMTFISKKELRPALNNFKKALKEDPQNPDALAGIGYVELLKDRLGMAEKYIHKALNLDSERIMALFAYGDLLIKQKKYSEGAAVYKKLMSLRPKDAVIKLSYEDALNGVELDHIKELIKADNYSAAADGYSELLQKFPDNLRYHYGLGQMHMRLKDYKQSANVNAEGLKRNPDSIELKIALAYSYLFTKKLDAARNLLNEALQQDDKNPEALAGLGRVEALEDRPEEAESYYIDALRIDPKNVSAASFYAELLMHQKRYDEAQEVYAGLMKNLPNDIWVKKAMQDAQDGPVTSIANRLSDKEEFELANNLYRDLLLIAPEDPARYLPVGQMYANLQEYCCALEVFYQGLEVDPEAWYLWRAVGFTYILMEEFCAAEEIFVTLLENDPEDAEAWAGLGRVEALNGSFCLAEEYYGYALDFSPRNLTALSFLSELEQNEEWQFSSFDTYYTISEVIDSDRGECDIWPKWITRGYNNALNRTSPVLAIGGSYHEELQWDFDSHRWSAQYQVYGGNAQFNYPLCDGLTSWGRVAEQFYTLKDLINHDNFYSLDVQRFHAGVRWTLYSCLYLDASAGISIFSPYRSSTFDVKTGTIVEPTLNLVYHTPTEKASIGLFTNSDLVARSFSRRQAKLVGYYTLAATLEKKVMRRGWVGCETDLIIYNDYASNSSERVIGWFQWRPDYYPDNFSFRYISRFQTFAKNIPDYYTYKPQFVNQLQATWEKNWRVCWADTFYTSLTYAHGWQNTRTKFKQIIVVDPFLPQENNYQWDNRQFDTVVGTMTYKKGPLQWTLVGDWYQDTERYTMWTIGGEVAWRF